MRSIHCVRRACAAAFLFLPVLTLPAQATVVVPNGLATTEGNATTAYPWGRGTGQIRVQYVYDSSHFTAQGVQQPILIDRLRWRANGGAAQAGGTYAAVTIRMSTCPVDQSQVVSTFASNHGADLTTVYAGPVNVLTGAGTTPNNWYVDVQLTTPFRYDPSQGDLNVDLAHDAVGWVGTIGPAVDCQTTGSNVARIYHLTNYLSPTGTVQANVGLTMEVTTRPVAGLFASFTGTPTRGATPLAVQFTDASVSTAPGGVTGWAWDFDNNGTVDSTLQNPLHTYTGCGTFDVRLTVTDGVHPQGTLLRAGYVVTDEVTAAFTAQLVAPTVMLFTDQSTPTPTAWAWDFNNDGVTDSTLQNPVWLFPAACTPITVTMTVSRLCRGPYSVQRQLHVANSVETLRDGNTSFGSGGGNYLDVHVTNPQGISVCALEWKATAGVGVATTANLFLTPDTYLGKEQNAAAWRQVAALAGVGTGSGAAAPRVRVAVSPPLYLPPGRFGLFVQVVGGGPQYTQGSMVVATGDVTLTLGASQSTAFSSNPVPDRIWNGALHYSHCGVGGEAGYQFFGPGCAGALGVPGNVATTRPRLGQTLSVDLNRLPVNATFMILGFSRTSSVFGPLPLDLGPFGAPGCLARISPDAALLVLGTGNTATWNLPIPNAAALLCVQFLTQGLALDPAANALGAVVSDAAAGIIGQ